ncbi:MAG: hypothetical protein ACI88H_002073 [Cocleimonas sp.]|jgi:hypothetical protein
MLGMNHSFRKKALIVQINRSLTQNTQKDTPPLLHYIFIKNIFKRSIVYQYLRVFKVGFALLLLLLIHTNAAAGGDQAVGGHKSPEVFLSEIFSGNAPKISALWIKGGLKQQVKDILGHPYHKLRVKYWFKDQRSVWVLDEIGKEKHITTGIVINRGRIEKVEVLAFRETRGWEVKYPFFTNQFNGVSAKSVNDTRLNKYIDGITGATLSVNALSVQARMALFLHRHVMQKKSK